MIITHMIFREDKNPNTLLRMQPLLEAVATADLNVYCMAADAIRAQPAVMLSRRDQPPKVIDRSRARQSAEAGRKPGGRD